MTNFVVGMKTKSIFYAIICATALLSLSSCGGNKSDRPVVTVSIEPQRFLLDRIAGNKVEAASLLPASANPETFEPTMANLMRVERSAAYFQIGNTGFENSVVERVKANNPDLKIIDTSAGVPLLRGTHHHHHEHGDADHHDEDEDEANEIDPHIWSSVPNARIIAKNILDGLVEIDPANADFYRKNFDNLIAELDALDKELTSTLAPIRGEAFLVWHPSLSYFARDYGLVQISVGSEGKESSVQHMKEVLEESSEHNSHVFFSQKEFDGSQAATICRQTNTKLIEINPLGYDWDNELRHIAAALAAARND